MTNHHSANLASLVSVLRRRRGYAGPHLLDLDALGRHAPELYAHLSAVANKHATTILGLEALADRLDADATQRDSDDARDFRRHDERS